ncbi:hypothetical protein [Pyrococcus kukulkanii]|uniref:Uncharacterized protein n=1 Tax=Pyrococcus kukulkanii TaxID=1609559 RepID=A0ABV4T963_9EURY
MLLSALQAKLHTEVTTFPLSEEVRKAVSPWISNACYRMVYGSRTPIEGTAWFSEENNTIKSFRAELTVCGRTTTVACGSGEECLETYTMLFYPLAIFGGGHEMACSDSVCSATFSGYGNVTPYVSLGIHVFRVYLYGNSSVRIIVDSVTHEYSPCRD